MHGRCSGQGLVARYPALVGMEVADWHADTLDLIANTEACYQLQDHMPLHCMPRKALHVLLK